MLVLKEIQIHPKTKVQNLLVRTSFTGLSSSFQRKAKETPIPSYQPATTQATR